MIIDEATNPEVGHRLFAIYAQTVKQHGGSIRYSAVYFEELIKLATLNSRLRVLVASHNDEIAGFSVVACHGQTAYYLHGGAAPKFKKNSPSDLLLNDAIHLVQREGSHRVQLDGVTP